MSCPVPGRLVREGSGFRWQVTQRLPRLPYPEDAGTGPAGRRECSSVMEEGRLMCKYEGHGLGRWPQERGRCWELLPQTLPGMNGNARRPVEAWGRWARPALVSDSYIQKNSRGAGLGVSGHGFRGFGSLDLFSEQRRFVSKVKSSDRRHQEEMTSGACSL